MANGKGLMSMLTVGALILGGSYAWAQSATGSGQAAAPHTGAMSSTQAAPLEKGEKESGPDRFVRGTVASVNPSSNPPTLTMTHMVGEQAQTVGVDIPTNTKITEGTTHKTLGDIKTGDHIWMQYDRMQNRLVADTIRILPPATKTHAKLNPSSSQSKPATQG
ncbi:MAG TPA: hypothetical protein VMD08_03560 [Candidatus Baltobacteraceae bacterium]|nr:hypothetical protein [Candidatus Baltobacteraceae bacterium]